MCIFFMSLTIVYFLFFRNSFASNYYIGLKPTYGIIVVLDSMGRLCC